MNAQKSKINENINLIRDVAWSFAKKTNIDFDDLFSEAAYEYCRALKRFDENDGASFRTFAVHHMKNMLINYCKKESKRRNRCCLESQLPEAFTFDAPDINMDFDEKIQQWSSEAREIVSMIFDRPQMYEACTPNFRRFKVGPYRREKKVKDDLKKRGWSQEKIDQGITEICRHI